MDEREWIVPAFSLRQFRIHHPTLADTNITPETYSDFLERRVPVILAAMQRNYPDLTEEQLVDMIDLKSFVEIIRAIQNLSGLRPAAQPGE